MTTVEVWPPGPRRTKRPIIVHKFLTGRAAVDYADEVEAHWAGYQVVVRPTRPEDCNYT